MGEQSAEEAFAHGIQLEVVKLPQGRQGFALLLQRWMVERSFTWLERFRRLARDYERFPQTLPVYICWFLRSSCLNAAPN